MSAWAGVRPRIVHRLSGGLDSSVVLAMLVQAKERSSILCVNETSSAGAEGDEHGLARLVARHVGSAIEEMKVDPANVTFERVFGAPLDAAPSMSILSFADGTYLTRFGEETALFTSGQGGDHIFHRSRRALIAADAVRCDPRPSFWVKAIYEVARLSGETFWAVASEAVWRGLARRPFDPASYFEEASAFPGISTDIVIAEQMLHPWLEDWRLLPPGHVRRLLTLIHALHYHKRTLISHAFCAAPVLLSQPIVEAAMAIPSYVLTHGGRERALYREAFQDLLPPAVLRRTTKGETTRHFDAVIAKNSTLLHDVLPNGELVSLGLVTKDAVEALLRASSRFVGAEGVGLLLRLFAAEAWLRRWKSERARGRTGAQ